MTRKTRGEVLQALEDGVILPYLPWIRELRPHPPRLLVIPPKIYRGGVRMIGHGVFCLKALDI